MPRESDEALSTRVDAMFRRGLFNRPVYCWDLDSTVACTVHRRHLMPAVKTDDAVWDDYALACTGDVPVAGTLALMHELDGSHVAVSGRSGLAEERTWEWFRKYSVPVDGALLRAPGDYTPNGKYKVRVVQAMQVAGADIRLFFEDWSEAAAEIAAATGIPVVGINPFDPAELGVRAGAI